MCTYNGAEFLTEQLQSIACQLRKPCELIVCDDGSTDDTVALLSDISQNVPFPVRLFRNNERLGPAANFEKAISLCEGEIIALSDQDDVWRNDKIEKIEEVFDAHPEAVYTFSDAEILDQKGNRSESTLWKALRLRQSDFAEIKLLKRLLKENVVTGAGMAFRSSFRDVILPVPSGWMHDYWIGLLGSAASRGIPISELLYKYRLHPAQACGWRKKTLLQACRISLTSGAEKSWDKLQQFQDFTGRLKVAGVFSRLGHERNRLITQKEIHLLKRGTVRSSSGLARIGKVLAETLSGRYSQFSGYSSIVRDLLPSATFGNAGGLKSGEPPKADMSRP